ncbi:MAG: hypothetical protein OEZ36_11210 [Spirochaetota bacterium]|nr:hypothetical protein [Spirochaetota bacterium]
MRYIFFLLILFSYELSLAQNTDKQFLEDLRLSDEEYDYKYIQKWNSPELLLQALSRTSSSRQKTAIIIKLTDYLSQDKVLNRIILAIANHYPIKGKADMNWKLRAVALYMLGEKGQGLAGYQRLKIQQTAQYYFRKDPEARVLAAAAYTLVKLATDDANQLSDHRLFNKRTISYLLSERIVALEAQENYLCWALARASIRLGDSFTCHALRETKKKPFHRKVRIVVQDAINILSKKKNE